MPISHSPYYWIAEELLEQPTLVEKRMFGCDALYLHGKLKLVLCPGKEEPWRGFLVATSRDNHNSLISQIPELTPHKVLGKWLYCSETEERFEDIAETILKLVLKDDPRIGVEPQQRDRKPKTKNTQSKTKRSSRTKSNK